jgi:hypothetical protein
VLWLQAFVYWTALALCIQAFRDRGTFVRGASLFDISFGVVMICFSAGMLLE